MWQIVPWVQNTLTYLPQHREPLYTVLANKARGMVCPLPPPLSLRGAVSPTKLEDLLHRGIRPCQEDRLSERLQDHLRRALSEVSREQ